VLRLFFCFAPRFFLLELENDLSRTKKYLHDLAQMQQVQNLMNVMVNPFVKKKHRRSRRGGGRSDSTPVEVRRISAKSKKKKKKKKMKKNKTDREPVEWGQSNVNRGGSVDDE
jgi:hypothetical protein